MTQDKTLQDFIGHFKRAIAGEMAAMRERMGSFEVILSEGESLEPDDGKEDTICVYRLESSDEKLSTGMECALRVGGAEHLVRVEELSGTQVTLRCSGEVSVGAGNALLVIYPWFLYERLCTSIDSLRGEGFFPDRALTLFGKRAPTCTPIGLKGPHSELNTSQMAAVRLCAQNDLAFVWGPPGTGKTTTLAHIVEEFLAQGLRVLVLSTTNAALDQALEKISRRPTLAEAIEAGEAVRIGRTQDPTFGAGLREVTERLDVNRRGALDRLTARRHEADAGAKKCTVALGALSASSGPFQQSLFMEAEPVRPALDLEGVFAEKRTAALTGLAAGELVVRLRRRQGRLAIVAALSWDRAAAIRKALSLREQSVVDGARLVLATLTNAYFSNYMTKSRFDVVIVEEASMAILPALFYAACLGKQKTVMVGDPCQLPSIVQSDDSYVRKVMGRNIFEVSVKDPLTSPSVAMLDIQYRMHPAIGSLVSEMFYAGRLKHGGDLQEREAIAAREPYPGAPVVVVDTEARTVCRQSPKSSSRMNDGTAKVCVELAVLAAKSGSVAIITPYADQAQGIRKLLRGLGEGAMSVECSTVHKFQGQERDTIILDTTDSEPMRPGVLLSDGREGSAARNLLNVAISRARGKLILVSDVHYFLQRAPSGIVTHVISLALRDGRRASSSLPPS